MMNIYSTFLFSCVFDSMNNLMVFISLIHLLMIQEEILKLRRPGRCPEIVKFVLKLELGPEICTYILKFSRVFTIFF